MAAEAPAPLTPHLWVVGPGRLGLALGLLLYRARAVPALSYTGRRTRAPDHPLFRGDPPAARYLTGLHLPAPAPTAVLITVPDAEIPGVARALALRGLPPGTPVLHTSGSLGADALEPLARAGCATGSVHPLAAVADAEGGAERLRGAWFAVEGAGPARELAERLVRIAGGGLLPIDAGAKPLYHAAAVFASNYLVALLAVAERLMDAAGAPAGAAHGALTGLARGALDNLERSTPAEALTGPIARGDVPTVRRHLERLSPTDRALYSVLAREALALARARGLEPEAAAQLEDLLGGEA